MLKKLALALVAAWIATSVAFAQPATTRPSLTNMLTANCTAEQAIFGGAVSPACGPTPVRAGDIMFFNGTSWVTLAGNNSGTQFLQENAAGVLSFAAVSGSGTVTSVTCFGTAITTSGTCTTAGQIPGVAGNTPASAGNVGEIISSCVAQASAVALSTGTAKDVTSISLTAGDWDVQGDIDFVTTATTSVSDVSAVITGTSNTLPTAPNNTAPFGGGGMNIQRFTAFVPGTINSFAVPTGGVPVTVASATTIFLDALSAFTASTASAYGCIVARRAR
jgi:hypothetical protein